MRVLAIMDIGYVLKRYLVVALFLIATLGAYTSWETVMENLAEIY